MPRAPLPRWPAGGPRTGSGHEAVKAFLAEKLALLLRPRLISQLVGRRWGGGGREEGLELRTAESYSQGLPSVGRAAQQELLLPRKLIIFNPGRRKERGEGEGLREKRRGWQRRGEDGEGGRAGKGKVSRRLGPGKAELGGDRQGGRSGRDCSQRQGQWDWGKPAGGLWEGTGCGGGMSRPS